jgi:class 3 adenylate cyclase/tetratricopeptide (TPR) repeat protein
LSCTDADPGGPLARSEHVTILFTDLVGSTELSASRSPEDADQLRREHFALLRARIATAGGAEVKNLGDGLMAAFPASSAAIGCAVAMQQGVEQAARGGTAPLELRVGVSAGEATKEDGDYFGEPVVEAARLCAAATGGQIVISDLARASAGRRNPHAFGALGALELKGLPEPVEAFEVVWEPLAAASEDARVPLPSRLRVPPAIGVVGRESEAQVLADASKRVGAGNGREVVLVAGEPGMGKTTLAAQCARHAWETGDWVLLGRSHEDLGVPYGPFGEALRHLVAHAPEELLATHVAECGGELAALAPELGVRVGELPGPRATDPDTERYLLFGAVVALLARAAAVAPLVLVLDDLHWADTASLQLLRHLVAADMDARVLVLATYRDSEVSVGHPLADTLAALRRETGVTRLDLHGLDDTGVVAFIEAAAGYDLPAAGVGLAHALSRETDGNPFFVGEVLRNLVETGAIFQDATGTWSSATEVGDLVLPDSVREVVGTRVARLGERSQRILSTAAVIGRDFDFELLVRVCEEDEDQLLDVLDEAARAALIDEAPDRPGHYTFVHALIQHTLYGDLGATRRARAHRKVAEALEALCGDDPGPRVGELAHHWADATQPVDAAKAISYARQAGERALAALAPDDAARYFEQALRMLAQQPDAGTALRVDLLLGLGRAQRQSAKAAFRETLLEAARLARELEDTERLVDAALTNTRGIFSAIGLVDRERVEVIESALAALPATDSTARARLLARLCSEFSFEPVERRRALAAEAKEMARRLQDEATMVEVVTDCAVALRVPSELEEQLADELELLASVDRSRLDPASLYWLCEQTWCDAIRAARFDEAAGCMAAMTEVVQRLGQPVLKWNLTQVRASEAIRVGDLAEADRLCAEAYEVGRTTGQPDAEAFYIAQNLNILFHQGRSHEMLELVLALAESGPGSIAPAYRGVLCNAYLDAGLDDEARAVAEERERVGFGDLQYDAIWFDTILNYARTPIWCDMPKLAADMLELLEPFEDQINFEGLDLYEPVATFLGGLAATVGRHEDAENWFEKALRLCAAGSMHYGQAMTELLWGRMLLRRGGPGDREAGRTLVENAHRAAIEGGYGSMERRASALLEQLG